MSRVNDADFALLAALLVKPGKVLEVDLEPYQFTADPGCGVMFSAIRSLASEGKPADLLTISERTGDRQFVAAVARGTGHPDHVGHYAEIIRKTWKLREQQRIGQEMTEAAGARSADPDEIAAKATSELGSLTYAAKDYDLGMKDVCKLVVEGIDRAAEAAKGGKTVGIQTGLADLDAILGGWHKTDLNVVAARPGMGKTAFCVCAAMHAAKAGYRVGVVSTEMPHEQLGIRMASQAAGIPVSNMRQGDMQESQWQILTGAMRSIAKLPMRIYAHPGCKVGDIVRQARSWSYTGLDLLLIDHLHRIKADTSSKRFDLEIASIVQEIKNTATSLNVPVILMSQLNRGLESRADKKPHMGDLRESGKIEEEADSVLMLYRPSVYDEDASQIEAEIIIAKNRHGEQGLLRCAFDGPVMRWRDLETRYSEERYV